MKVTKLSLPGVLLLEPQVFEDERGFFMETYNAQRYSQYDLPEKFVQDNHSKSVHNTLRGLHYQLNNPQGKLVRVIQGEVFDVAVDVRKKSPTFGEWVGIHLSGENKKQLYIPEGFAHGFCVLSETAEFLYKCTDFYSPKDERGIIWNDPSLAIEWPIDEPIISGKDCNLPKLSDIENDLPLFKG